MTNMTLRRGWLSIHKWIGLLLAIVLVPVSLTGAALVWHDPLDRLLNPVRYTISDRTGLLPPSAYIEAVRPRLDPRDRISGLRFSEEPGQPVMVMAARAPDEGRGRPYRTSAWLDPASGKLLDIAPNNAGLIRWMHVFHGSLMIPGLGRQIVGWLGVAMLISCISGLWLWWPLVGGWTRGLRWQTSRPSSNNLHHQTGFWVVLPLAMLAATGILISFPQLLSSGSGPPRMGAASRNALPLVAPKRNMDQILAMARQQIPKASPLAIVWPSAPSGEWLVTFSKGAAVRINDSDGTMKPAGAGQAPGSLLRTMRRWHDGDGMGIVWQSIIFVAGIAPALLGITGILMWLRRRRWNRARL